jgi:hypothetical protein
MFSETKYLDPSTKFFPSFLSLSFLVGPHPVVVSRLRHLPVTRTQLSHHDIIMRPQRPAPIQFFAPELLTSCRLVWRQLCRDRGSGVVGDGCVLGVNFSFGGSDVVCWLVGSCCCCCGGGGLSCRVIVGVRVSVPF